MRLMKYKIGVVGSAAGQMPEVLLNKAKEIGREIAKCNCILLSGAGPGLPYEAVKGAKDENGFTIGFSPASCLSEHVNKYEFPTEHFDVLIFTGSGLKGRNVPFIRTCDGVIAISGRIGTLNEFTMAYDEKKVIGVLKKTGGISEIIKNVVEISGKKGGKLIYNSDPKLLVNGIIKDLRAN